ncbi:MAG: ketol-acid reductoisomerase, partial [Candidatus Zixiibacteriota bacterium]
SITILGYGSQGRAIALNLRDSGYDVLIGLRSRSKARKTARSDKFTKICPIAEAVKKTQVVCVALPDHVHGRVFQKAIRKNLNEKATLLFLHGFSVHFGFVKPPDKGDVIMIAPHAPGLSVREEFISGKSLSAFYAVHQDYSGIAEKTVLALAKGIGFKKNKLLRTTFEIEALGDLFGEQAVLCGGVPELIQKGFEILVDKGIPPENAYLEVAYQLDLIVQLIKQYGIEGMYQRISVAARYGSIRSGKKIIDKSVKKRMKLVFEEIKSGKFANKLNKLKASDITALNKRIKRHVNRSFDRAADKFSDD